jgi:hypothetical protein
MKDVLDDCARAAEGFTPTSDVVLHKDAAYSPTPEGIQQIAGERPPLLEDEIIGSRRLPGKRSERAKVRQMA